MGILINPFSSNSQPEKNVSSKRESYITLRNLALCFLILCFLVCFFIGKIIFSLKVEFNEIKRDFKDAIETQADVTGLYAVYPVNTTTNKKQAYTIEYKYFNTFTQEMIIDKSYGEYSYKKMEELTQGDKITIVFTAEGKSIETNCLNKDNLDKELKKWRIILVAGIAFGVVSIALFVLAIKKKKEFNEIIEESKKNEQISVSTHEYVEGDLQSFDTCEHSQNDYVFDKKQDSTNLESSNSTNKICEHCGSKLESGSKRCSSCGSKIK